MKSIFTLLLGGFLTTSAFANTITLSFNGNRNYQVIVDGRNVNDFRYSNNTIYLNDLQYGQHSLQVYRMKKNGKYGNKNNLVYSSYFNSSPQYDLNIAIDNNGSVQMYQSRNNDYGRNDRGNNHNGYGNRNDDWNKHRDGDDDRNYDQNNGYDHGNNNNGNWNNNRYAQAMNDYDFNQLIQKIRSQWLGKNEHRKRGHEY